MKLLANGCSMTHGQELVTDSYNPANTELCYAKILADQFDMSYDNIALPGISNKHIVESTLDYLITKGYEDTFVLIGWTSPIRYCFTHNNYYVRFNIHNPPAEGEWLAGPQITEFHKQFIKHMNDPVDLARTMFHEVNYLATWLERNSVPYAMSYMFEEPGYSQSRRRLVTPHWSKRTGETLDFGNPSPNYLHKFNILTQAHWYALGQLTKNFPGRYNVWASGRHPNRQGHEIIAKRLKPLIEKQINTI